MTSRGAVVPLLVLMAGTGCSRAASPFSTPAARAHVDALARGIGSRPLGTAANARARDYLATALRGAGFSDVQIKIADARRPDIGLTARVANIVALKPGSRPEAIALVAHYDSEPGSPGATDDALGVAVAVEAGRALAAEPSRTYSLMVLLTDGEEPGLMGAAAAVADRAIADRIVTYLNIDSIGSSGPSHLFEAGPGNGWLVRAWARAAPRPRGASFAADVYRRLPNDTDFSILKRTGAPGLNFAPIGDSYAYHTPRDTAERLSDDTIRQTGENVVAIVDALDRLDLTRRTLDQAVYFDLFRSAATAYGPVVSATVTVLALVTGLLGWMRVARESVRRAGAARLAAAIVWTLVGAVLVWAAMVGATIALRTSRETYHPWYAQPGRLLLLLAAVGAASGWGAVRAGTWLPAGLHGIRHPALVWTIVLPVWVAFAALLAIAAPLSSFLWTLPLGATGLLLMAVPLRSTGSIRVASAIVLGVAVVLWADNLLTLMQFTVAVFGRFPIITPPWIYATLVATAAIVLAPPAVALLIGGSRLLRPAAATGVALLAVAVAGSLAWIAPAYTVERPLRRAVRYVHDAPTGVAFWEVASVEPGLDLGDGAPPGWELTGDDPRASVPVGRLPHPFVFRRLETQPPAAPAETTMAFDERTRALTVEVRPAAPGLWATFVLPDGVHPAAASLPGVTRSGRWIARFAGVPSEGIAFRATLPAGAEPEATRVVIARAGLPGGAGPAGLPAWLPAGRTVWDASATWILAPLAPRQPLR